MVAILPAGPLQKCRAADTATEVESYTRYILSLRQFAGYVSIRSEVSRFLGSSVPADYQSLLLYGLGPAFAVGHLLPHDRKPAP
jgi:hypothetical protein